MSLSYHKYTDDMESRMRGSANTGSPPSAVVAALLEPCTWRACGAGRTGEGLPSAKGNRRLQMALPGFWEQAGLGHLAVLRG